MPMDPKKYPKNWNDLANLVKFHHGHCQQCGAYDGAEDTVLTVHHIDHDPMNSSPYNLVTLCARCHLKAEGVWKRGKDFDKNLLLPEDALKDVERTQITAPWACPSCRTVNEITVPIGIMGVNVIQFAETCSKCKTESGIIMVPDGYQVFPVRVK